MSAVLITGSSGGLGFEFAKLYLAEGRTVLIHGRDEEKLQRAAEALRTAFPQGTAVPLCADLGEKGGAVRLFEAALPYDPDLLINNAGLGYTGPAADIDPVKEEEMILVNDLAPVQLTRLFLKYREKEGGTILNVASTGAFQPGPYIAEYYASKAFLLRYTQGIAEEADPEKWVIACLCPGPLATDFYARSGVRKPAFAASAEDCARCAKEHLKHRAVIVPGLSDRMMMRLPASLKVRILKKMKKKQSAQKAGRTTKC